MLRKKALSSTSSTRRWPSDLAAEPALVPNQSAKVCDKYQPRSMTSVALPLITAVPIVPLLDWPSSWKSSTSSAMSRISSTT